MTTVISQFVRGRRLSLRTLHETRETLEPALARLAAAHRTDNDLQELNALQRDLVASVNDFHEFSLINMKWHDAVAKASHNELLSAMLHAISYGVAVSITTEDYATMETRMAVIRIHSRIIDAIAAQNSELAERLMQRHIGATHERATAPGDTSIPLSNEE